MAPRTARLSAVALLLARFGSAAVQGQVELVYQGTGGCDGTDTTCHDVPEEQRIVRALQVGADGSLLPRNELAVTTPGLPIWLASKDVAGKRCVFFSLADKDQMLSAVAGPDGKLTLGAAVATGGRNPVHMTATPDSQFLLVANYNGPDDGKNSTGSSVASMRIADDCSLTLVDSVPHSGSSVDPARQGAAHPHSFYSLGGGLAVNCDLGLDIIFTYKVGADGKLTELAKTHVEPGLGPRHIAKHPTMPFIYVVCEMGQAVLTYELQADGSLSLKQTHLLYPQSQGRTGSKAAEIAILPDGSAVFATNRGLINTVTSFAVGKDGSLTQVQEVQAPAFPRGMTLASGGKLLLVGGQSKTEVVAYAVQGAQLTQLGGIAGAGVAANVATFLTLTANGEPLPSKFF